MKVDQGAFELRSSRNTSVFHCIEDVPGLDTLTVTWPRFSTSFLMGLTLLLRNYFEFPLEGRAGSAFKKR